MSQRSPYQDPLDLLWLSTARALGIAVVRSDAVFASWDGAGTLTISTPAGFDPDDCLAQMIFHELCHALTEGPDALHLRDWGLENIDQRDLVREHTCHRLQASLLIPWGLRRMLAPTTDHRAYYDALPDDPLSGDDASAVAARAAVARARTSPWAQPIQRALQATAQLAAIVRPFAGDSLWAAAVPHR